MRVEREEERDIIGKRERERKRNGTRACTDLIHLSICHGVCVHVMFLFFAAHNGDTIITPSRKKCKHSLTLKEKLEPCRCTGKWFALIYILANI